MKNPIRILSVYGIAWNPFILTLAKGIASDSFQVDLGNSAFWNRQPKYDIIQIHWPEFLFTIKKDNLPTNEYGERLRETMQKWKKEGAKIVFTQHDDKSHYIKGQEVRTNLFEIIETEANAIVHLGDYSRNRMAGTLKTGDQLHAVIPHHVYDTYYSCSISQVEARKALDIDTKYRVILTFGVFRDAEEHLLIKNAFEQLNEPDKFLLAPSWYHDGWHEYRNRHISLEGNSQLGQGLVDRDMLPYCFAAADVVFLQRLRNLNSGNLMMGFFFNKTVVGPAIGNITAYLDNINNFSFDPFDPSSVLHALEKGIARAAYPQENEMYARERWNTAKICEQYRQLYRQFCDVY